MGASDIKGGRARQKFEVTSIIHFIGGGKGGETWSVSSVDCSRKLFCVLCCCFIFHFFSLISFLRPNLATFEEEEEDG